MVPRSRPNERIYRVSWRRARWAPAAGPRSRLYLRRSAALAFAEKIAAAAMAEDEIVGVWIEFRDLVPGGWTDIQELEQ